MIAEQSPRAFKRVADDPFVPDGEEVLSLGAGVGRQDRIDQLDGAPGADADPCGFDDQRRLVFLRR